MNNQLYCTVCKHLADLCTGRTVYPKRPDLYHLNFWVCNYCGARCGCYENSDRPKGTFAGPALRKARQEAHIAFDSLWRNGAPGERGRAYKWLAQELGIPQRECHIGKFDLEMCQQVIRSVAELNAPPPEQLKQQELYLSEDHYKDEIFDQLVPESVQEETQEDPDDGEVFDDELEGEDFEYSYQEDEDKESGYADSILSVDERYYISTNDDLQISTKTALFVLKLSSENEPSVLVNAAYAAVQAYDEYLTDHDSDAFRPGVYATLLRDRRRAELEREEDGDLAKEILRRLPQLKDVEAEKLAETISSIRLRD